MSGMQWKEDSAELTREGSQAGSKPFKPDTDYKTDWDLVDAMRYGLFSYGRNGRVGVTVLDGSPAAGVDEDDDFLMEMARAGYYKVSDGPALIA
jgi:hypothetical protein